jgi:hypothetical protein
MAKRLVITSPRVAAIPVVPPATPRLDPAAIAQALGAEPCLERREGWQGPLTLYALRQELFRRRQSSGGRPAIEGTSFRAKISLGEEDWHDLEALAESLSTEGFAPSPGQVGSVLLSLALDALANDQEASARTGPMAKLGKQLASRLKASRG